MRSSDGQRELMRSCPATTGGLKRHESKPIYTDLVLVIALLAAIVAKSAGWIVALVIVLGVIFTASSFGWTPKRALRTPLGASC